MVSLFEGEVTREDDNNFLAKGKYHIEDDRVIITELPVGEWTSNYKVFREKIRRRIYKEKQIKSTILRLQ